MTKIPALQDLLTQDDASRYLTGLTPEQRRPQYISNALPTSPKSFTKEEREAVEEIYCPTGSSINTPHAK